MLLKRGVCVSNLTTKINFAALKAQVHKLHIKKMVNIPTGLNNLKTKVDDLDVDKMKTVPVNLKKNKWCSEYRSCKKDSV